MRRRPLEPEPGNAGGGNHGTRRHRQRVRSPHSCSRAANAPTRRVRRATCPAARPRDRGRLRPRARARARRTGSTSWSATSTRSIRGPLDTADRRRRDRRATPHRQGRHRPRARAHSPRATGAPARSSGGRRSRRTPRPLPRQRAAPRPRPISPPCTSEPASATPRSPSSATGAELAGRPGALCSLLPVGGPADRRPHRRAPVPARPARRSSPVRPAASATSSSHHRVRLARARRAPRRRARTPERTPDASRRASSLSLVRHACAVAARPPQYVGQPPRHPHRPRSRWSPTTRSRSRSRCCAAFKKQTGITVKVLQAGDAGAALNQVILTKSNPIGDVFFGVDNTFLTPRARRRACSRSTRPPRSRPCPPQYQLDPSHRLTPDRPRRRVHQLRQAVVREAEARGTEDARRPDQARVQGPARRREPGDVVARVSRSSSRPSRSTATTAGATTGRSCAPTT